MMFGKSAILGNHSQNLALSKNIHHQKRHSAKEDLFMQQSHCEL